jgi:non-heme chloroperoxidase
MTIHRVKGGAGVELCVEETGNAAGRPVLFIHGVSQCRLAWTRQLRSDLGDDLRLVAADLRGHGLSEQPTGLYGEASQWADDIAAIITELDLRQPILCGWSYGGVVIGDYLHCHGSDALGGIALVGAASRMGEPAMPFLGPQFVACLPGLFSNEADESSSTLQTFLRLCQSTDPDPEDFYTVLGYNTVVSPQTRQEMLSRPLNYDELFAGLRLPVLITHGLDDKIVEPTMSQRLESIIPEARASYYTNVGHSPFHEDTLRFNTELRTFATSI